MIVADSSVIVAAVSEWHEHHAVANAAFSGGAVAHAVVESYSVLTRLPEPLRARPADAAEVLRRRISRVIGISPKSALHLPTTLASLGIFGGATYDALIALTVAERDATLLTLDQRAVTTYRRCGVNFELLQ